MKNNSKIIITVLMFLVLIFILVVYVQKTFYFREKAVSNGKNVSDIASTTLEMLPAIKDITQAERDKVYKKNVEQVIVEFNQEKADCLAVYDKISLDEDFLGDNLQMTSFAVCSAVKNNDLDICDKLKDETSKKQCLTIADNYLNFVYPVLEKNDCNLDSLNVEQRKICQAVVFGKSNECGKIIADNDKNICLAIAKKDILFCDKIEDEKIKNGCRNIFNFMQSVRSKDLSFLDKITDGLEYSLDRLYFDKSLSCNHILNERNEKYCNLLFSNEKLDRITTIAEMQNK